jgi:hypothetical protein
MLTGFDRRAKRATQNPRRLSRNPAIGGIAQSTMVVGRPILEAGRGSTMKLLTNSFLSLCIAACIAMAGCATSSPRDVLVEYYAAGWWASESWGPGFAGFRSEVPKVTVTRDGLVWTELSRTWGPVVVALDTAAFDDLQRKIADAQFPALQESYGCPGCADGPVYVVEAEIEDQHYEVRIDGRGHQYPGTLQTLFVTLQDLAGQPHEE